MSAQKKESYSTSGEFKKISAALAEPLLEMIRKFFAMFNAEAEPAEYGILFLQYINQFFDDKRKIAAAWHIFSLGLHIGELMAMFKIAKEKQDEWLAELAVQSKKDGGPSA